MTNINRDTLKTTHYPERERFEIDLGGGAVAELDYRRVGDTVTMYHTEVPPAFRGQGIADVITRDALTWAKEQGYKVNPTCWFVRAYMQRHPEFR